MGFHSAAANGHYERHRPETTALYEIVRACTMRVKAISEGMGGKIEIGKISEGPCDTDNGY